MPVSPTEPHVGRLRCSFVPGLPWVERTYRQAAKHLHAAEPGDVCDLLWAWAQAGYTPRDRLFMNQVMLHGVWLLSLHLRCAHTDCCVVQGGFFLPARPEAPDTSRAACCAQVKITTRCAFQQQQLSGGQLVRLMHGMARMPRYAPNAGWLLALAREAQPQLYLLPAGELPAAHLSSHAHGTVMT